MEKLKSDGKMNLHATLSNQQNKIIENNILKLNIQSETQKKEIIENKC